MRGSSDGDRDEWRFGEFELAPWRGRLAVADAEVSLARKSFEVLVCLVRNHDRFVTRQELLAEVWPGTTVSDAAVASAIRDLRRALGDTAKKPRFIATARGRGMRFVHPVQRHRGASEQDSSAWDEAAVHFERALQALELLDVSRAQARAASDPAHSRERSELTLALARARWSAGASDEARQAFLEAAAVARRTGDPALLAQAALGFVGRTDVTPGVNRAGASLLAEALSALDESDSALRAEVMARLGTELYYDEDQSRSDQLTEDALAMAERLADPGLTAYAATARHFSSQRPDVEPEDRLPLADLAISLTTDAPPSDVLAFALQERLIDLLELGRGDAFAETFEQYERVVETLAQPFFEWLLSLLRGTRALLAGEVEAAEALAHETLAKGNRLGTPNAGAAFAGQIFSVRREQNRLAELLPVLQAEARRHEALPIFRAASAAVAAAAGEDEAAASTLEALMASDLEDFPRDQNWIATLGTLAPAVAAVGSEQRLRQLIGLMRPFAGRMIVVGQGATTHGSVDYHLGLLRRSLGDNERAIQHFDDAARIHERAHAPLWVERTRQSAARC